MHRPLLRKARADEDQIHLNLFDDFNGVVHVGGASHYGYVRFTVQDGSDDVAYKGKFMNNEKIDHFIF